ncbi:MAG TPA: hypothetical protein VNW51_03960, partial [Mucilaginibacter sp.]|nr:hypothetical protein [Mucilaginibacter sp.]
KKLSLILFLILLYSCKNQVKSEVEVYNNDFETNNLTNITNGVISQFNGTAVLGIYNNGNFILKLDNLPKHDLITISFDLYIHDGWDGNKPPPDGPDIWQMLVDGSTYIYATFSNDSCIAGNFCSPQSYPFDYPNSYNNPKTGAYRIDLPGFCSMKSNPNGTTQYKIIKTFTHKNGTLVLQCLDKLVQTNATDPKCDESWSVDNINIKAITL